ncbi:lipoyl(octanoyl) transferase LipB [Engelhardtia mirabilis]|uniref:Octanoyltransferase n=1 Tax=Engelhardtia mirabilis TaxID=2528011 RepID=A0A518BRJ3_9BACT|nr:Octanoyltransferase [Planctomycetes bacterium Pla133]QDV03912.1 Octanoyltransferase [Planctomycetes bacterium Pla86]
MTGGPATPPTPRPPLGPELEVRRLGRFDYARARDLQQELVAQRAAGEVCDQLLLLEHPEVVTLGRRTPEGAADGLDLPLVEIERGGEATWHGPGQLVAYPLFLLPLGRRDLHAYLRDLEEVVLRTLADLGVEGERREGLTGVWAGGHKVCSIGVAVRRWVTWHGLALNVSNDLAGFERFRPCGLEPGVMGRVADLAEVPADDPLLEAHLERHVRGVFGHR